MKVYLRGSWTADVGDADVAGCPSPPSSRTEAGKVWILASDCVSV